MLSQCPLNDILLSLRISRTLPYSPEPHAMRVVPISLLVFTVLLVQESGPLAVIEEHFWEGCGQSYGLGMDALVNVCSWNTNVSMDLYGLGMDALVTVCSWNTSVSMD